MKGKNQGKLKRRKERGKICIIDFSKTLWFLETLFHLYDR